MAIDDDLSALVPDPPPSRPARREAAIEEAVRRFDGAGQPAPPRPEKSRPNPVFQGWGRPQIAVLASAALVVLVSVPIWLAESDRFGRGAQPAAVEKSAEGIAAPASQALREAEPADGVAAQPAPVPPAALATAAPSRDTSLDLAEAPAPIVSARGRPAEQEFESRALAPPPPAAAERPAAPRADSEDSIIVTGGRISRQRQESSSPIATLGDAALADGPWNTCTLRDPDHDLAACRAFANPAAGGRSGQAGAQLADGLALAWGGQLDRAIDAFDRAIRAAPDLSIAYLNRGLAYQAKGNLRRALADLDRAVGRDPDNPRGYYHRSLLHRAGGDTRRAETDARRAIALDPDYRSALP